MEEFSKRLIEVEYILNRLDTSDINKVPQEIWDFIKENKDSDYNFEYDINKTIMENNLHKDTIAILTYININFLLNSKQKKEMIELLKIDELVAEQEKKNRYNPDDIFKNKNNDSNKEEQKINIKNLPVKMEEKNIFKKIIMFIKKLLHIKKHENN